MTNNKIDKEADEIWKFQRYMLILDFEERLCFPPPLTVINYMYLLACYLHSRLGGCREDCIAACTSGVSRFFNDEICDLYVMEYRILINFKLVLRLVLAHELI